MPTFTLPYWLSPGDDRPDDKIEEEVREELQLHLDLLVEEQTRRGATRDAAQQTAAERFGDFDKYTRLCRKEKQGDAPMLRRIQAVLIAVLTLGVGLMGWQQWKLAGYYEGNQLALIGVQDRLSDVSDTLARIGPAMAPGSDASSETGNAVRRVWPDNQPPKPPATQRLLEAELQLAQQQLEAKAKSLELQQDRRAELVAAFSRIKPRAPAAEASLAKAQAKYDAAATELEDARAALGRLEITGDSGAEFPATVDQAKAAIEVAELRVHGAEQKRQYAATRLQTVKVADEHTARQNQEKLNQTALDVNQKELELAEAKVAVVRAEEALVSSQQFPNPFDGSRSPAVPAVLKAGPFVIKSRAARGDITGVVTGADGQPLADADVLLIIKTWPNNRFRQDDKAVKTDADGRFTLKRAVPLDGQYGVNAAVVAPGHAIASSYVLVEDPAGEEPEPIDFELTASTAVTLRLTNRGGEPLPRTFVAPSARNDSENEDHLVYFQGSKPAWRRTGETGTVEIDWFAAGDFGKVSVKPRGGDWQEHEFETPAQPGEIITVVCDTKGR